MRVLRVLTRLNIGGPAIHAALLSTRLDPARFATWLVVGEPEATEGDLSALVRDSPARLIHLRTLKRPIRPWADLVSLIRLIRILWDVRPQLIHTHMAKAGALGRLAGLIYNRFGDGRRPGQRAVLIHIFHGHVLDGYFPGWLSQVFVMIERWLARHTDVLIAVSGAIRDELLQKGVGRHDRWRVVPLGVDLSGLVQLPFPQGTSPLRVGVVGRLVPIKNTSLFLQAFASLAREPSSPAMRGVVVGDGPLRETLEREARRLGLEQVVHFTGWQRDLRAVYEDLDVACLTSWNEGTPVSLIEAMAAGRAVVATDVGGVRDVLEPEGGSNGPIQPGGFRRAALGLLVRPGDVEGLAEALRVMAADSALRARIGQAARASVTQRFSAERLIREMTQLYDSLRPLEGTQRA